MINIPYQRLSADALLGVIDEFINREGTDYGHRDFTLAEKRAAVMQALGRGQAVVTFDPVTMTTSLVDAAQIDAAKTDADDGDDAPGQKGDG